MPLDLSHSYLHKLSHHLWHKSWVFLSNVSHTCEGSGIQVLLTTGPSLWFFGFFVFVFYLMWTEGVGDGEAVGGHKYQTWASLGVESRQDCEGWREVRERRGKDIPGSRETTKVKPSRPAPMVCLLRQWSLPHPTTVTSALTAHLGFLWPRLWPRCINQNNRQVMS